jgi:glycogen operon protein
VTDDSLPLGATCDPRGVTFALAAPAAARVELCLFGAATDRIPSGRIPLTDRTGDVWHVHVEGARPGQIYGYCVDAPDRLLFDPYARAVGRRHVWLPQPVAPLAAVVDDEFDWRGDRTPGTPWSDTVIYEAHVKGFTARHPGVAADARGTYRGLATPAALAHLRDLGVTAIELMPVHFCVDERALSRRGLTNYWGYNTLGFFAPDPRLASAPTPLGVVREFKEMVRAVHAQGIEVILDVVYNHTAEGDHLGPALSMRGIDNAGYYRLDPHGSVHYQDFTGCGNTLDTRSPLVERLVLDSLRYWITEMHVDGFRFDLTSAILRGARDVDMNASLLRAIGRDPIISRVKLIAEPWDATPEGYRLGQFPAPWSEWNGRYRDDVRRYWRGDIGARPSLATRLAGSSDLFGAPGRGPRASINFVTAHDGFTLADLVSYSHKHNELNGEGNRDGESQNFSANHGVEGPATDAAVLALRARAQRSLLLTLLASQGVPMISGGDELGRSQLGNNNAYCQDSALSWTPWRLEDGADLSLLNFVQRLTALRRTHAALRRREFFENGETGPNTVSWLTALGEPLTEADWHDGTARALAMQLASLVVLFNGSGESVTFRLPAHERWRLAITSGDPSTPMTLPPGAAAVFETPTNSSAAGSIPP